jgi:hypothetical protein
MLPRKEPTANLVVAVVLMALAVLGSEAPAGEPDTWDLYSKRATWGESLAASRERCARLRDLAKARGEPLPRVPLERLASSLERDFPIQADWVLQDAGVLELSDWLVPWLEERREATLEARMVRRVLADLGDEARELKGALEDLERSGGPGDRRWLDLHVRACERRRRIRLRTLLEKAPGVVFTKHLNLGGSHYAYTEGLSDAQGERQFEPGASLCILEMEGIDASVRTLISDPRGIIRDPDVSHDGKRILFSWKKSDREDDYHLHELTVETGAVRQLTSGLGFADYEGVYLPSGDILFNSTRCVQTVDCWWTEVSNLYTCDKDGRFLRRVSFDQVHTNYPQVLDDGRVIYTRWDYSDRGQIYPQGLFQMNQDGTAQTELYGNNSWFPTTILHARGIPGSRKMVAILTGHHTIQTGKLAWIDPALGRQENAGVRLICPPQETPAVRVDAYGQGGPQFQYPYPLGEDEFVVGYSHQGRARRPLRFGIYFMTAGGARELLACDPGISCSQPVPLAPRRVPHEQPAPAERAGETGVYYLQDIYRGEGLAGVPRGTIRRLRVVALSYRAAGIGQNNSSGPGGAALSSTPVSVGNGCWDVKVVLGSARVHDDGSAAFIVPARTPVYFQALDAKGQAVQTMRSWSTLQGGEHFACAGCHESKNTAPPALAGMTSALRAGPEPLDSFHGPPRGFSFIERVQPILDRHCIRCHDDRERRPAGTWADLPLLAEPAAGPADESAGGPAAKPAAPEAPARPADARSFSLLGAQRVDSLSKRRWSESYLALTQAFHLKLNPTHAGSIAGKSEDPVRWITAQSEPSPLPPYHAGSPSSRLLAILDEGHGGVRLTAEEMEKIACWIDLGVPYCGDYTEANAWSEAEKETYRRFLRKRKRMEDAERQSTIEWAASRAAGQGPSPPR